ncbi:MAG: HlyD family efflux transporter periplasmic adaptor subunit [Isosphaeraceae bacterium]
MRNGLVLDLADCTEFRQTLQARPPRILHGTAILLVLLLVSAVAWAALTEANLVVRAPGRIRPVSTITKVYVATRGEVLSASVGGRVAEVRFREGDRIKRGELLIRLETGRLENEVAKQRRTIRAGEEELANLNRLEELLIDQHHAARLKAEAELTQAREALDRAQAQRDVEIKLAESEFTTSHDQETRLRRLLERKASSPQEVILAAAKTLEAREKLNKARIPVEQRQVEVHQRSLELAERDFAVKRSDLNAKRMLKQTEVESARIELANRELERDQAEIRTPIDGIVTAGEVKVGDLLEPGKPAVEIAEEAGFRFEAVVSSDDIGHLRTGMPVRIKLDAYDYQRYGTLDGRVGFIAPDSGVAEQQKTVVYTVKIDVSHDEVERGAYRGRVKLGMAGQAEIVTDRKSVLLLLVKQIRQSISLN